MFRLKYFNPEPVTCEELKSLYRKLAMVNHPDAGGDAEAMKAINGEYEYLFARLKNVHANASGEKYTSTGSRETAETPEQFIEIIDRLIRFEGVKIEIIGAFIWVSGNTKVYKEQLKEMGFRWHSGKVCWYLAPDWYVKKNKKHYSMNEVRNMFGAQEVELNPYTKVSATA